MIPSPVPEYNFDPIPTVTHVDDFWYRKYGETEDGRLVRIATTEEVAQTGRRDRRAPAVAVVLADRDGLRPADHRLRPDLQPVAVHHRRPHRRRRHLRLGHSSRRTTPRRRTTATRPRRPTPAARPTRPTPMPPPTPTPMRPPMTRRRSSPLAEHRSRRPRRAVGAADVATIEPRHQHRHLQHQVGHVALPGLGVPALRRPDHHLPALQDAASRSSRARPRTRSTTSRSPRSARSCC